MKKIALFALLPLLFACDVVLPVMQTGGINVPPTQVEVTAGLKEALKVGIKNAVASTSKTDGFYGNSLIKIPFPEEAIKVRKALLNLGMTQLVNDFDKSINRAAEQASAKATDIFVDAITQMTFNDAMAIWKGENNAATTFLKRTTSTRLEAEFKPIISTALQQVEATKYWNDITTAYNKIPFVTPVNTDLEGYVTHEAIDGLFTLVAQEEKDIRTNPEARVSSILQRVFGYNNTNAQ